MSPEPGSGTAAPADASDGADADAEAGTDADAADGADSDAGVPPAGADPGPERADVLGAPPSMEAAAAGADGGLTPMLSQYLELCRAHEDALLLFQVGDFYEAFCEAAEETARVCETTLTERTDSTGAYPMAGIPIDNATTYLERLLDAGYRVAIADQVEDAAEASGLVDRAVTRVVTPGTLTDDDLLSVGSNYVACVTRAVDDVDDADDADDADGADGAADAEAGTDADAADGDDAVDPDRDHAVAVVDVSTGDCRVTGGSRARVLAELDRLDPAELLVGPGVAAADALATLSTDPMVTEHDPAAFERAAAAETLARYGAGADATGTAPVERDVEVRAAGALLSYAEYTQGGDGPLSYVSRVVRYDPRDALLLDAAAIRSLELFEPRGDRAGTALTDVVDRTVTAPGRRRLEAWLRRPLLDRDRIRARHGAVAALVDDALVRADLRAALREVYDVERLISRVSRERANARDLRSLLGSLDRVPEVRERLADLDGGDGSDDAAGGGDGSDDEDPDPDPDSALLAALRDRLDELADVRDLLREAVAPDPSQELTEGGVIREGFDDDLDDLRATEREGREWVADLEARERERTGIDSLSVGHNQVHGYYIEVTDPNLDRVPDDYTRRQTLKNAERFYTPELKRREDEILGAAERADALEYELFREVRARVAEEAERVQAVADALADLDALASFAAVAADRDYVRPTVRPAGERGIEVAAGRHPVVETTTRFVPNDVRVAPGELVVVTGPNMSGKSTYMRQVALTCVLSQAGSFVPADAARLPVLDRVFTRVGASDDIAGGQSTFMREMTELTAILREATADSLLLLDEVGRGTSTTDGRAIARAAAEFVHDEVGAHALFATHYHELTSLADDRERVRNVHFSIERAGDDGDEPAVEFLHRAVEGPASSSYGIEVARLAGVPDPVVSRARTLVARRTTEAEGREAETEAEGEGEGEGEDAAVGPTLAAYADGEVDREGDDPADDGTDAPTVAGAVANGRDADGASTDADRADEGVDADALAPLREVDLARTTPLEALNLLADLQRRVDDA